MRGKVKIFALMNADIMHYAVNDRIPYTIFAEFLCQFLFSKALSSHYGPIGFL